MSCRCVACVNDDIRIVKLKAVSVAIGKLARERRNAVGPYNLRLTDQNLGVVFDADREGYRYFDIYSDTWRHVRAEWLDGIVIKDYPV